VVKRKANSYLLVWDFPGEQRKARIKLNLGYQVKFSIAMVFKKLEEGILDVSRKRQGNRGHATQPQRLLSRVLWQRSVSAVNGKYVHFLHFSFRNVLFPVAPTYVASDSVLKLPQSNDESLFFSFVMKSWALVTINLFFLLVRCTYFDPAQCQRQAWIWVMKNNLLSLALPEDV
jgi:hypothetical protein